MIAGHLFHPENKKAI